MDRIIIAITKLSRDNWGVIYRFIKSIVKEKDIVYRQKAFRDINTIAQLRINVGLFEETAKDVYSLYGDFLAHEKLNLLVETTCFSIIYQKSDDSEDFTELVPFILLQHEFGDSITLGIDIGELEIKKQQSYRFRCSDFFYLIDKPTPKLGKNSLYFINAKDVDKETGELKVYYTARFAGEGEGGYSGNSSRRFLPLIKITENNYKTIFGTCADGDSLELRFIKESIEKTKQDWKNKKPHNTMWSDLSSIFDSTNSPFEQWFESGYFNSYGKELKDINKDEINGIKNTLQIYKNSIVELIQNIIFHGGKKGLLYCVFDKKSNLSEEYQTKIPDYYTYNDTVRFLRIGIFDYCSSGIIDTFADYLRTEPYKDAIKDSLSLSLRSFFDKDNIVTKGLTRLEMRYAAGLGIKTFVKTIVEHKGFFSVESNFHSSDGCKKTRLHTMLIEEKIMLGPEEESDFAKGTHYRVVLPIVSTEKNKIFPFQRDSLLTNSYFNTTNIRITKFSWTVRDRVYSDFSFISNSTSKNEQIERIKEVGSKIIEEVNHSDGTVWNLEGKELDYNIFFKLVSFVQLNTNERIVRLILVNTTDNFIKGLYDVINELIIEKGSNPVWSRDFAIIVYSESLYSMIIWGEARDELYYINQESQRYNHNYFFYESPIINWDSGLLKDRIDNNTKELVKHFVLPYEILINTDKENRLSLFESFLSRLLKRKINPNNLGFLVNHENTYIGNKIIVKNYYEADLMFQNNYFTERFAYLIAQNIKNEIASKSQQNKRVVLIGYNHYSEVLLKSIENWLKKIKSMDGDSSFIKEVYLTIFFEGKGAFDNDVFFDFDIDKNQNGEKTRQEIMNNPGEFLFATIVPIGSTLSTNDKIISYFKRWYKEGDISNYLEDDMFFYNHCVIVVRDSNLKDVSLQEKGQRWVCIDLSKRIIRTSYTNAKEIHFSTQVAKAAVTDDDNSNWARRLNKEISFKNDWWREEYVNYTENSSINSQNLMGFPRIEVSEIKEKNHDIELDRIYDLKDDIYKGHIEVLNCHHKYYIDTERFVKRSDSKLANWLQKVKADDVFNRDNLNVIITPNVERESDLIIKIKDSIFDGNALIIYLDVNNWRNNMIHKLSYLKNFPNNDVKFHYVDQAFLSGETFQKSKSYLFSILEDTSIGFASIITVVNRLSYAKNQEIKNDVKGKFFSFVNLHYPGSKEGGHDCELCQLDKYYEKLSARTVLDSCNDAIIKNRMKLIVIQKNNKNSKRCTKRGFIRMVLTHEIYYRIAEIVQRYSPESYNFNSIYSDMEEELNGIFEQLSQNRSLPVQGRCPTSIINKKIDDWFMLKTTDAHDDVLIGLHDFYLVKLGVDKKISFLKVISSPPLSKYIAIRKYAHEKLLLELHMIIDRTNNDQNDFVFDDLKIIKSILKSLSFLKSNALVRKDVITGVWRVLGKVLCNLEKERNTVEEYLEKLDKHIDKQKLIISQPQGILGSEEIKNDIIKLEGLREEMRKDLRRLKEDEIIWDFSQDVQFFIKNAIVEDDAKSTYLGELLRQGEEMKSFDSVVISKTRLSLRKAEGEDSRYVVYNSQREGLNDLFCNFSLDYSPLSKNNSNLFLEELKDKTRFQKEYNSFLVWLFYDNTTIIRKTLENFSNELIKDNGCRDLFFDNQRVLNKYQVFKERIGLKKDLFRDKVKKEYYYTSFMPYLENGDEIDFVQKLLYVTYAKLKLEDLTTNKHKTNIRTDTRDLMEIFASIMGADAAFWTMKERNNSDGKYGRSNKHANSLQIFPISLFDNDDENNKWKSILYNMNSYYTYKTYTQKKLYYPLVPKYSIKQNLGERLYLKKHSLVVYTITENNRKQESYDTKKTIVSCITFLYEDGNPILSNEREFRIKLQESGRLLLLLKKDISEYVVDYLLHEKVFELWVEELRTRISNQYLMTLNRATNHIVTLGGWDFDNLPDEEYLKIYNGIIILANVTIRHLYADLIENKKIDIYSEGDELKLIDVFSKKFTSLLSVISVNKLHRMSINIGLLPSNMRIKGLKTVFQSYIIKYLIYADRHFDTKKTEIQFYNTYFEIKSDYRKKIIVKGLIKRNFDMRYDKKAISEFLSQPYKGNLYEYDRTLLTLPFYLEPLGMRCEMGFDDNETYFSVKVYYPPKKIFKL